MHQVLDRLADELVEHGNAEIANLLRRHVGDRRLPQQVVDISVGPEHVQVDEERAVPPLGKGRVRIADEARERAAGDLEQLQPDPPALVRRDRRLPVAPPHPKAGNGRIGSPACVEEDRTAVERALAVRDQRRRERQLPDRERDIGDRAPP